jgi:hypothetical protein
MTWLGACALLLALAWTRLRAVRAFSVPGLDFWGFFAPAARAIESAGTPYIVDGYVYSPIVALMARAALLFPDPLTWWSLVQLLAAGAAVFLMVLACRPGVRGWRVPVLLAFCGLTLLWSWTTDLEMSLGQVELLILLCLAAAALAELRARPGAAGVSVAVAVLLKTWPIFPALWFLRRGARGRGRSLLAGGLTVAAGAALFAAGFGVSVLGEWVRATRSGSVQPILSYSAFGVGRELFQGGRWFEPFVSSPTLRWVVTGVLIVVGVTLLALVLRWPGDSRLALWHVVGCGLFLQPVSHLNYLVLLVPVAWLYAARLLEGRAGVGLYLVSGVVGAWWFVAHRMFDQSRSGYLLTVCATLMMLATSIGSEALHDRRARSAAGPGAVDDPRIAVR